MGDKNFIKSFHEQDLIIDMDIFKKEVEKIITETKLI
jgi:hypothetical protein